MKLKNRLVYIIAVLMTLPLVGTIAQAQTITVLQRFDYPSNLNHHVAIAATVPNKINDEGDTVGTVIDISGKVQGFIYKFRTGKFSYPFSDPNGGDTQGQGINNLRHVCGEYLNASDRTFHGYLLKPPTFSDFDVAGAVDTFPLGINNSGSIVGTVTLPNGDQPAFASVMQHVNTFAVPGATATFACQLNASNQILGYYTDANGINHGYTRDSAGNLTFPIDVPGSTGTMLLGNNDSNWGVGSYTDASEVTHGLYFITPDDILTYDYPGATFTSLTGINRLGIVCGYYYDAAGIAHGLVAQVNP